MTDYEDLAFKPAMTWGELCEYAKSNRRYLELENGFRIGFGYAGSLTFYQNGEVTDGCGYVLKKNVYYEQMKNIIDNLYGED